MKLLLFGYMIFGLSILVVLGQTPETPPVNSKPVIQTPFGPKQVDGSPAVPPTSTASPQTAPVPPSPVPSPGNTLASPAGQTVESPKPATVQDQAVPIELHFDNEDIYPVIRIIADALHLNYDIDPQVKGTVNINTSTSLRQEDLFPILESILKINGATIVKTGNFYEIVPAVSAAREPLQVHEQAASFDSGNQMTLQIVRTKFVSAVEMARMLTPYLSEGGNITVQDASNTLLITDRLMNLHKLLEIVDMFDSNAFEGERVRILPAKNGSAKDIVENLETLFAGYASSEHSTTVRFIALDRLNSILVIASNAAIFPTVEEWMEKLDKALQTGGVKVFVYKVKNTKARQIQKVLADLYGYPLDQGQNPQTARPAQASGGTSSLTGQANSLSQGGVSGSTGSMPVNPGQMPTSSQTSQPLPSIIGPKMRIVADETNNALVIQAAPQDYAEIERTIEQLDILPRQVLIDAQIFDVELDDTLAFGLSAALQGTSGLTNPPTTASYNSTSGLSAQTFTLIGSTRALVGFLTASDNRSKVRTLSAPSILVSDNASASFEVGTEVPVPTSSAVSPIQSAGSSLFAQTIQMVDTGVILQVKPQINDSGNVTLDISQEVSQAEANTFSAIVAPAIGKDSVTSTIVAQDGQTIAIGGFISDHDEVDTSGIPFLSSIPWIGGLFGTTTHSKTKSEIIVLITPHVIRTHADADVATEELKAKLGAIKNFPN